MAQHVRIDKLEYVSRPQRCIEELLIAVKRKINYVYGQIHSHNMRSFRAFRKPFVKDVIWKKEFTRLSDDYLSEDEKPVKDWIALSIGDYFVGKRRALGGRASIEVHLHKSGAMKIYIVA